MGNETTKTPEQICPDFPEWPRRWCGVEDDVAYGQGMLEIMRSFVVHLIKKELARRTIKNHMDNLWILGGEVIREVSENDQYDVSPLVKLQESVGLDGGPYCRHIDSEKVQSSFDATCRKLFKFLELYE